MRIHSYLSPSCEAKESDLGGKGVYAKESINIGDIIAVWGGKVYTTKEIDELSVKYPHFLTHPISIWEGFFLGPTSVSELDDAEDFNHSCNPNAGVKGQLILVARKKIKAGEEICFDYDTTEIDSVPFDCKCGAKNCRKIIDGSSWSSKDFFESNKEFLSLYVYEKAKNKS